jgi:hypothetical protein
MNDKALVGRSSNARGSGDDAPLRVAQAAAVPTQSTCTTSKEVRKTVPPTPIALSGEPKVENSAV